MAFPQIASRHTIGFDGSISLRKRNYSEVTILDSDTVFQVRLCIYRTL